MPIAQLLSFPHLPTLAKVATLNTHFIKKNLIWWLAFQLHLEHLTYIAKGCLKCQSFKQSIQVGFQYISAVSSFKNKALLVFNVCLKFQVFFGFFDIKIVRIGSCNRSIWSKTDLSEEFISNCDWNENKYKPINRNKALLS